MILVFLMLSIEVFDSFQLKKDPRLPLNLNGHARSYVVCRDKFVIHVLGQVSPRDKRAVEGFSINNECE